MRERADRWDYLFAGALGVLTVLSRLPFRTRMLYSWDAVQFAPALREYDVVKHQPHPPGYILYVGLGRLVDHWATSAAQPAGLVEIELPYGRFLYTLPVGRRPIEYASYTFVRDR
jgi:hypothetical protein